MVPTFTVEKNAAMLTKKRRKIQAGDAWHTPVHEGVWVSSKADAFIEGIGSLLDIFPDARPRTIRAFECHHAPHHCSVDEAIWGDWAAIGQDMWAAIEAHKIEPHKHEEAPEEAAATEIESLTR